MFWYDGEDWSVECLCVVMELYFVEYEEFFFILEV